MAAWLIGRLPARATAWPSEEWVNEWKYSVIESASESMLGGQLTLQNTWLTNVKNSYKTIEDTLWMGTSPCAISQEVAPSPALGFLERLLFSLYRKPIVTCHALTPLKIAPPEQQENRPSLNKTPLRLLYRHSYTKMRYSAWKMKSFEFEKEQSAWTTFTNRSVLVQMTLGHSYRRLVLNTTDSSFICGYSTTVSYSIIRTIFRDTYCDTQKYLK